MANPILLGNKEVINIKDGKIFTELKRESGESKKDFFNRIIQVVTLLGGEMDELI